MWDQFKHDGDMLLIVVLVVAGFALGNGIWHTELGPSLRVHPDAVRYAVIWPWVVAAILGTMIGSGGSSAPMLTPRPDPESNRRMKFDEIDPGEGPNPKPELPRPLSRPSWWAPVGLPILLFTLIATGVAAYLYRTNAWPFHGLDLATEALSYLEIERTRMMIWKLLASAAVLFLLVGSGIRYVQHKRFAARAAAQWADYEYSLVQWEEAEAQRHDAELERVRQEREARHQREMEVLRRNASNLALVIAQPPPPPPQPRPADPAFPEDCRALGRQLLIHAADDQRAAVRADDPEREAKLQAIERSYENQLMLIERSDIHVEDRVALHAIKIRHDAGVIPSDLDEQLFEHRADLEYQRLGHLAGVVADPLHREDERVALRRRLRRLEGSHHHARGRIAELEHKLLNAPVPAPSLESSLETDAAETDSLLTPEWQAEWDEYDREADNESQMRALASEKIHRKTQDYAASLSPDDPFRDTKIDVYREAEHERLEERIRQHYHRKLPKEESNAQPALPARQIR